MILWFDLLARLIDWICGNVILTWTQNILQFGWGMDRRLLKRNCNESLAMSLCKFAYNFWTRTLEGSCTALELQKLKISSPKTQPRASWSFEKFCLNETRSSISYHALTRAGASFPHGTRFHALYPDPRLSCMTSSMTSAKPVWPTWKFDPARTACEKKKIKINK